MAHFRRLSDSTSRTQTLTSRKHFYSLHTCTVHPELSYDISHSHLVPTTTGIIFQSVPDILKTLLRYLLDHVYTS